MSSCESGRARWSSGRIRVSARRVARIDAQAGTTRESMRSHFVVVRCVRLCNLLCVHIATTGITSGIGLRLAEVALARGHSIRALVRDPDRADAQALERAGVTLVSGDLTRTLALEEVARGADVFIHLAAHVSDTGAREQFELTNVVGTRNALEAAATAAVPRFIHLSSTAVYGRPDRGRVDEAWPMRRTGNAYDDTKTEAEQLVFRRGKELGLSVNALRPPLVYGPYDRQFLPRVLEALRAGRALLIAGGRAPLNMVWVDHVVEVLLRVAARSDVVGQCFNVMDELDRRPPSVREVIETIARAAELPPPRISLPYPVAMVAAGLVEFLFRFVAATKPPPLTRFVVKALTRDVIYDSSKAAEVLGWKPQVHSLEGIAREVRRRLGTE